MRTLLFAASALGLVSAGAAHANPVQYDVTDANPFRNGEMAMTLHLGNFSERVQAGQITVQAKDVASSLVSSIQTYCTDIFDTLLTPTRYTRGTLDATVDDGPTISAIGALIQNGNALVNNAVSSAGLQLAVWEVLYDGFTGHNDVTTGNFYVSNIDPNVIAAAQADLTNVDDGAWKLGATSLVYELLPNGEGASQYLSYVADPVPEPATLSLLGLGAMGLAFARRRRRA